MKIIRVLGMIRGHEIISDFWRKCILGGGEWRLDGDVCLPRYLVCVD